MPKQPSLERRAIAAGIDVTWTDAFGVAQRLSDRTLQRMLEMVEASAVQKNDTQRQLLTVDVGGSAQLPYSPRRSRRSVLHDEHGQEHPIVIDASGCFEAPTQPGYYELTQPTRTWRIAVAPTRCFFPMDGETSTAQRHWGLTAQVYALRREHDGGLGDSRAVMECARQIARYGGDALGVSPMHAVSPSTLPYSPYAPSDRRFLDWVYADPSQWFGEESLQQAIQRAGVAASWKDAAELSLVDWPAVRAMRRKVMQALHETFLQENSPSHDDLREFTEAGGEHLREFARMAAREQFAHASSDTTRGTDASTYAHAESRDVFMAAVQGEIFAQWVAARCWKQTQHDAREAGQRIGLIGDLAVGCQPSGSEAWAYRDAMLHDVQLGAPPDAFNRDGQQWGITTYSPWGLKNTCFQPFIDLIRANMALWGGLRIDHIIGLQHMWVVPDGHAASEGGYLHYPLDDMLRLLALESWRHRCIVIGEDLGTVPDGLRTTLAARGVLGIDVLLFMRDQNGLFMPPSAWRDSAVATTTTHDLPPLSGWREALDLAHLAEVQAWPADVREERIRERRGDAQKLDDAMAMEAAHAPSEATDIPCEHRRYFTHIAQSPSPLLLIPMEDAIGRKEQANLPGTVETYPNWRHRLPMDSQARLEATLQHLHHVQQLRKSTQQRSAETS